MSRHLANDLTPSSPHLGCFFFRKSGGLQVGKVRPPCLNYGWGSGKYRGVENNVAQLD